MTSTPCPHCGYDCLHVAYQEHTEYEVRTVRDDCINVEIDTKHVYDSTFIHITCSACNKYWYSHGDFLNAVKLKEAKMAKKPKVDTKDVALELTTGQKIVLPEMSDDELTILHDAVREEEQRRLKNDEVFWQDLREGLRALKIEALIENMQLGAGSIPKLLALIREMDKTIEEYKEETS